MAELEITAANFENEVLHSDKPVLLDFYAAWCGPYKMLSPIPVSYTHLLHTKQGNQRKELHPGEKPEVCFALCEGDEVEAVYAYCNLHSLWKA